jgi:hypothetical protein
LGGWEVGGRLLGAIYMGEGGMKVRAGEGLGCNAKATVVHPMESSGTRMPLNTVLP